MLSPDIDYPDRHVRTRLAAMRLQSVMGLQALINHWNRLSLARQFAIASFATLTIGMLAVGSWVTHKIEQEVVHNAGVSAALFSDSFIAPLLQELSHQDQLSEHAMAELGRLIDHTSLGERVLSFKIWQRGGRIVFSTNSDTIGKRFPVTDHLREAWSGQVAAEFDRLGDEEDADERALDIPLLEIYSPVRARPGGQIIAVSEFYSMADDLNADLWQARQESWLIFGLTGMLMLLLLSGIAIRGSRLIDRQQHALEQRVRDSTELRDRVESASRRSTELTENYLRRVGADLHDGPAQLVALALLRLDSLTLDESMPRQQRSEELGVVRKALDEAMTDIRNISRGLSLPDIEPLTLEELLRKVIVAHQQLTNMQVALSMQGEEPRLPASIKICLYRFVQESLMNAFKHGQTSDSQVLTVCQDGELTVRVEDTGVGFDSLSSDTDSHGLGLPGMRERIESVGGFFHLESRPGIGTTVEARFVVPLNL